MRSFRCVLGFLLLQSSVFAATIAFGSLTDPAGDSTGAGDREDLVFASVSVDDANHVTFTARFAPSTFFPPDSMVEFFLDLDQNPATGFSFRGTIGFEAGVAVPFFGNPFARVSTIDSGITITEYSFTTLADGYSVVIPLADLNATRPVMNFKADEFQDSLGPDHIQDYISDFGAAPGVVSLTGVPEPASLALVLAGLACMWGRTRTSRRPKAGISARLGHK